MVSEAGSYRSPTGPNGEHETHDQWSARKQAEAAAQKREAGLEARLAALEKRIAEVIESTNRSLAKERKSRDARYAELIEAVRRVVGDLRGEIDQQFDEVRERTFAVDDRAEMVRLARQVKACSREIAEAREDIAELKSRGKGKGRTVT
ncbi:hypothetical protein [Sinorhizobium meliloti]|uniref:hypothetical protein n=1 Tax=Rhizobium meliloti TaxID=382 RepID=UPI00129812E0|nr:hypothetical protein [Sinorhizobium meliloti]MQX70037.1 hypothetical protein [Sinorhizobium meliloti]